MNAPVTNSADALSAYFVRRFLTDAKVGESMGMGSGPAAGQFADMLRDSLATAMSEGDKLGLSEALQPQGSGQDLGATLHAMHAHAAVGQPDPRIPVAPLSGVVTSDFGLRSDPLSGEHRHHGGVDLAAAAGTPVVSAGPGVVVRAEAAGNYGNLVVVDHGDGLQTRYAHLHEMTANVGDKVEAAAPIGSVGQTGRTTGPHLHFEVRRHGHAENPLRVISALNAAVTRSR